jgi:dTMP kinase
VFISFEGPEGAGKSTQIHLLADALTQRGQAVMMTREPGGTAVGEGVRAVLLGGTQDITPEAEAYLMTGARAQLVRECIRPALAEGKIVLCDRFADSTLAYQGAARGLPIGELRQLQRLAVGDTMPDLTLLIDIDVSQGLARRQRTDEQNRLDREGIVFHEHVANWYREEAASDPQRWRIVAGDGSIEEVHSAVLDIVQRELQIRSERPVRGGAR